VLLSASAGGDNFRLVETRKRVSAEKLMLPVLLRRPCNNEGTLLNIILLLVFSIFPRSSGQPIEFIRLDRRGHSASSPYFPHKMLPYLALSCEKCPANFSGDSKFAANASPRFCPCPILGTLWPSYSTPCSFYLNESDSRSRVKRDELLIFPSRHRIDRGETRLAFGIRLREALVQEKKKRKKNKRKETARKQR